jgi:hypothetical protein
MKGVPLLDTAVTPGAIPDDWWLSLTAAGVELFLGVWLLFGVFPQVGRFLALVTFAGFAGVAIFKAMRGEPSCGCLGALHVNPNYMAAFDLFVVLAICSAGGAIAKNWRATVEVGGWTGDCCWRGHWFSWSAWD